MCVCKAPSSVSLKSHYICWQSHAGTQCTMTTLHPSPATLFCILPHPIAFQRRHYSPACNCEPTLELCSILSGPCIAKGVVSMQINYTHRMKTWRGDDEQKPWEPLLFSLPQPSHSFSPSRFLFIFVILCFPQSAWNVTTEAEERNTYITAWAASSAAQVSIGTLERIFPSPVWQFKHIATNQKLGLRVPRRINLKSIAQ